MRIIAGAARGRKILSVPKSMVVRPISSRMRQSLFDILRPRLMGSRFLDLFAGTGTVGLEALSRGAEPVVFVDMDARCVRVIEKNLERIGWSSRGKVYRANLLSPMSWIAYRAQVEQFDIIFLSPPYKDQEKRPLHYTQTVLQHLVTANLLSPDGWIVAQHHKKEVVSGPGGLELFRTAHYGDTTVDFYRRSGRLRSELSSS